MKTRLVLLPLLLISCIPNRLVPYDFTIQTNNSEAYVDFDSVTIALKNLEIKSDHYVFGMGVQNKSSKPIFINIDKIQKHAHFISHQDEDAANYYQEVVSAMSPQQVNQFFEAKKKNAQAAAAFLFLVGAAISTYDAIKDEKDKSKEYWTEKDEKKSITRDLVTSSTLFATNILTEAAFASGEKAEVELRYLPDELFDRKVISPGEDYYGKVLFKKIGETHNYHRIICPIEDRNLLFDFRKATIQEKKFLYRYGH